VSEMLPTIAQFVVPALIIAWMELRRRRIWAVTRRQAIAEGARVSDFEAGQALRNEIRRENAELRARVSQVEEENGTLRRRVDVLDRRIILLTELCVRAGIEVPAWQEGAGGAA